MQYNYNTSIKIQDLYKSQTRTEYYSVNIVNNTIINHPHMTLVHEDVIQLTKLQMDMYPPHYVTNKLQNLNLK